MKQLNYENNKEEEHAFSIKLPVKLKHGLKVLCAMKGRTLKSLLIEIVQDYVDKQAKLPLDEDV